MHDSTRKYDLLTREECLGLMNEAGMLQNIVRHSLEVVKISLFLTGELNKHGQDLDLGLVEAASLLHDLTKTKCLQTKEDHAQTAFQLLTRMGYGRIGEVVAQHVRLSRNGDSSNVSEEEVVNYADKRVQHDQIVSLRERFIDLKERYGKGPESLRQMEGMERATFTIEQKIFSILCIDPENLKDLLAGT